MCRDIFSRRDRTRLDAKVILGNGVRGTPFIETDPSKVQRESLSQIALALPGLEELREDPTSSSLPVPPLALFDRNVGRVVQV